MVHDPNSLSQSLAAHDASRPANSYNIEKLGNYKIIKKLGEGGMGAVFLAEDVIAQRPVALKVLPLDKVDHPNAVSRFRREAKAIGKLSHPNIIQAYALGEEHGFHFYAMERCEGHPLDTILDEKKRLSIDESLSYTIQTARGLEHAHAHGIIHRDIKPGNLFITGEGVVKILDLGLSKNISSESEQSFVTGTGTILGTPYYISPEQALGKTDIDGRTDIYSLGATLYHLVTGHTPFSGGTAAVIVSKHLVEKVRNPHDLNPAIPESLVLVIQRMMAKAPGDRYANCTDLLEDLEAVANGVSPASTALDPELTSILPRSAVVNAVSASVVAGGAVNSAPPASFAAKIQNLSFGAKVVGVCGAFAALLAVVVIARALLANSAAPPPAQAAAKPPDESVPQWTKVDEQSEKAAENSGPESKPANLPPPLLHEPQSKPVVVVLKDRDGYLDLLSAIDPKKSRGTWTVEHGELTASNSDHAAVSVPVDIPKEYDVRFEFSTTGQFALMLPCDGKTVVWMISNRPCGSIVGCPAEGRPVSVALHSFDTARKHNAIIEVRLAQVRVFIDNLQQPLQEWKASATVSGPAVIPWFDGDQTKIALGSNYGNATVYSLKLKNAGHGK